MALFLKDEDVNHCLSMADMLEAIETMQRRFGQGAAYNLARRKIVAEGGLPTVKAVQSLVPVALGWAIG